MESSPKKADRKRFVRYKESAEMYSMCQSKFEDMTKDALLAFDRPRASPGYRQEQKHPLKQIIRCLGR